MECIQRHDGKCVGPTEMRDSPDRDDGKLFPRCEYHWEKRLASAQKHMRKYPVHAPADFDPMDAGESWDEEY